MNRQYLPPFGYNYDPVMGSGKPFFDHQQIQTISEYLNGDINRVWFDELCCIFHDLYSADFPIDAPNAGRTEKEVSDLMKALDLAGNFKMRYAATYHDLTSSAVAVSQAEAEQAFRHIASAASVILRECRQIMREIDGWKKGGGGRPRGAVEDPRFNQLLRELLAFYGKHGRDVKETMRGKTLHAFIRDCLEPLQKVLGQKEPLYKTKAQLQKKVNRLRGTQR